MEVVSFIAQVAGPFVHIDRACNGSSAQTSCNGLLWRSFVETADLALVHLEHLGSYNRTHHSRESDVAPRASTGVQLPSPVGRLVRILRWMCWDEACMWRHPDTIINPSRSFGAKNSISTLTCLQRHSIRVTADCCSRRASEISR